MINPLITMPGSMMLPSNAPAHIPAWTIRPHAYVNDSPNSVDLGQQAFTVMWPGGLSAMSLSQILRRESTLTTTVSTR